MIHDLRMNGWMDLLKLSLCLFGSSSSSSSFFRTHICIYVMHLGRLPLLPYLALLSIIIIIIMSTFPSILFYSRTRPDDDDDDEITQSGLNLLRALHIYTYTCM